MARTVNFGTYDASKSNPNQKKKVAYFKLAAGESKVVRLFDEPVEFYKYTFYDADNNFRFVVFNDEESVNSFCEKYGVDRAKISPRLAINLFNKSNKTFEVYEFTHSVMAEFSKFQKVNPKDKIGGPDGMDFKLSKGSGKIKKTSVEPVGQTKIDKAKYENALANYCYDLAEVYSATPADLVEKIMNGSLGKEEDSGGSQNNVNNKGNKSSQQEDFMTGQDDEQDSGDSVPF